MQTINGSHEGDIATASQLVINGSVNGNVLLRASAVLELHGTISGTCEVQMGAKANILGTIDGVLWANGGSIQIYGVVDTLRITSSPDLIVIHPNALIRAKL